MLLQITDFKDLDSRKLMDIYAEGNEENVEYFYPDCTDKALGLQWVERDFLKYLLEEFFNGRDKYFVLEEDGEWVSALRLYSVDKGLFYIEALETKPDERRKGYATRLLLFVLDELKGGENFTVCSSVSKQNKASLSTHFKCGFEIETEAAQSLLDGSVNERCYGLAYRYKQA